MDAVIRDAIVAPENQVLVSSATAWELAIKQARGRLEFPLERFEATMGDMGFDILPILPAHAIAAGALPRHHGDPFDRMLIAQAQVENLVLVTQDTTFSRYDVSLMAP